MDFITDTIRDLRRMNVRTMLTQGVQLGLIASSALIMWLSLKLITGSDSPVVVVLSGSMEPGIYRGDILFLNMGNKPFRTGEIVVFNIDERPIPIVHRIIQIYQKNDSDDIDILTKGDNNYSHDRRGIYAPGQNWLNMRHIMGRAVGIVPKVGMMTILMNDYPYLKFALIGILGLMAFTNKEG